MTKMTHDMMIEVIQAHKQGKRIQKRGLYSTDPTWRDDPIPHWNFYTYEYRIKPEPRKHYWVECRNVHIKNSPWLVYSQAFSEQHAQQLKDWLVREGYDADESVRITEFVEVLRDLT